MKVTILANANTGLATDHVFYFGNVVGDVNGSVTSNRYAANTLDTSSTRTNQSPASNSVPVTNVYDFNKSGNVNALDTSIVRINQQASGIVRVINDATAQESDDFAQFFVELTDENHDAAARSDVMARSQLTARKRSDLIENLDEFFSQLGLDIEIDLSFAENLLN